LWKCWKKTGLQAQIKPFAVLELHLPALKIIDNPEIFYENILQARVEASQIKIYIYIYIYIEKKM